MYFENDLTLGILLKRYKRFLADVELEDGKVVTAHVPNTGSMKSTNEPGSRVAMSYNPLPSRKLKWSLELVQAQKHWVGVNTSLTNRIVEEAIVGRRIGPLRGAWEIRREVKYGKSSRIDLLLEKGGARCYVEVKNVTYKQGRRALFPDAVTARGAKHLLELAEMVRQGHRAVAFFLVNRGDCSSMGPAWEIDPKYSQLLKRVSKQGVELMA